MLGFTLLLEKQNINITSYFLFLADVVHLACNFLGRKCQKILNHCDIFARRYTSLKAQDLLLFEVIFVLLTGVQCPRKGSPNKVVNGGIAQDASYRAPCHDHYPLNILPFLGVELCSKNSSSDRY